MSILLFFQSFRVVNSVNALKRGEGEISWLTAVHRVWLGAEGEVDGLKVGVMNCGTKTQQNKMAFFKISIRYLKANYHFSTVYYKIVEMEQDETELSGRQNEAMKSDRQSSCAGRHTLCSPAGLTQDFFQWQRDKSEYFMSTHIIKYKRDNPINRMVDDGGLK